MKRTISELGQLETVAEEVWGEIQTLAGRQAVVMGLVGGLGAGKTAWAKAMAKAAGIDPDEVVSPTYVLNTEFDIPGTRVKLQHLDIYRLEEESEFWRLGVEEMIKNHDIIVVEWVDKFPQIFERALKLGAKIIQVKIETKEDGGRQVEVI